MILNGFFSGRKLFFPIAVTVLPQIENKQAVGAEKKPTRAREPSPPASV
jgi:hypothetical protein